jgi:Holliday junction resolvase RusA-like endonuclease
MIFEQTFPFPPLSQNNIERTGGKTNIRYKTKVAKDYKHEIEIHLAANKDARDFAKHFDPSEHVIFVDYVWYLNTAKFFKKPKKKGDLPCISQISIDWDNPIKYTQDCITKYLGINDSYIVSGHVDKLFTEHKTYFKTKYRILDIRYYIEIVSSKTYIETDEKRPEGVTLQ